jgi:hypothetical protein
MHGERRASPDLGIVLGSGTEVAAESAGIILVKNNLMDVVRESHRFKTSKPQERMVQNLARAVSYDVIALPFAAGVLAPLGILLTPTVAVLLMPFRMVIVAAKAPLLSRRRMAAWAHPRYACPQRGYQGGLPEVGPRKQHNPISTGIGLPARRWPSAPHPDLSICRIVHGILLTALDLRRRSWARFPGPQARS